MPPWQSTCSRVATAQPPGLTLICLSPRVVANRARIFLDALKHLRKSAPEHMTVAHLPQRTCMMMSSKVASWM